MIRGAHIARYRGIRDLDAHGFGRVNLVIGRNDCGKTAFLEALQLADDAEDAIHRLLHVQRGRLRRGVKTQDFERFWRPMFFDLDAETGLSIRLSRGDHIWQAFHLRRGSISAEFVSMDAGADIYEVQSPTWALEVEITANDQAKIQQRVVGMPSGVKLPSAANKTRSAWIASSTGVGEDDIRFVSALKQRGQDQALLELLREVDPRLSGIELLAPGGDVAELFVRLDNGTPMLPVPLMGEGFQRCLELGAAAAAHDWPTLFIDEVENGMHHVVVEPLWRWIATISRRRNLQVFATTHSEECIHAACRAFEWLDDDGLRVIRLDRLERSTRTTFYDRALLEVAERTGTEIRG